MGQPISRAHILGLAGRTASIFCCAMLLGSPMAKADYAQSQEQPKVAFDGELSVLTYNVKGLPWPLASDRPAALEQIAQGLKQLRVEGRQPEVVLLQEAFTDDARNIAAISGYRYVADGPAAGDQASVHPSRADRKFAASGSWIRGEDIGKLTGSGIQIMSDFPITEVHKRPFPAFACAGYDCLSNKGMMLAVIDLVPLKTHVQVGNIHMNSKRHSMVSQARQEFAYERQVDTAHAFFRQFYDARYPMVFGGDFNIGQNAGRARYLFGKRWPIQSRTDSLRRLAARSDLTPDAQKAVARSADWQFAKSGSKALLEPVSVDVPFGTSGSDAPLSDHIGYTINYSIQKK